MRTKLMMMAAAVTVFGGLTMSAQAMPLPAASQNATVTDTAGITLVAGGCGIGFHRGPYGGCRVNRVWRGPYRRHCVVYRTRWGVRRVCR